MLHLSPTMSMSRRGIPKKNKEGEGERSHWTEAQMSAVMVVHQNIEHYCGLHEERSRCSSSDVSCCGGPTSEFCMQHKVQQSLKKVKKNSVRNIPWTEKSMRKVEKMDLCLCWCRPSSLLFFSPPLSLSFFHFTYLYFMCPFFLCDTPRCFALVFSSMITRPRNFRFLADIVFFSVYIVL